MYNGLLPPHCPEAERGVLGCCLQDVGKTAVALKAGVNRRWFYETRHAELFQVLAGMALNGGGDLIITVISLRERGKLESVGGLNYLVELQNSVPSPENIGYYLPELRDYFQRRQILDVSARLNLLANDLRNEPSRLLADTEQALEILHRQTDATGTLPEIIPAPDLLAAEIPEPPEIIEGVLHHGSKLILGGASKSYKTWAFMDLALSVATGTPWLGFPTKPGKVLYVNLEIQAAFFRRRLREVMKAKGVEVGNQLEIWNLRGYVADYRVLIPKIRAQIRDQGHVLIIIDPTYKLLGMSDENSASDISALLSATESLAMTSGAAVALAGHFAKGNAAAKETIDRISGSGVFARDPDSLITFTRHEEEDAFTVDFVLRNLPPIEPFVARWDWPLFDRTEGLDPSRLKQMGGRPMQYTPEMLLECLGSARLTSSEWKRICRDECGISHGKFFELLKSLVESKSVQKSAVDGKWEKVLQQSRNSNHEKDQ